MSKKKVISKHIQKGRFYHFHEGSPTGHPGMVFWKNDSKNLYLALTTDTSLGPHRTKLTKVNEHQANFVQNKPLLAKRKDIGGLRENIEFNKKDKKLLKDISKRPYRETLSIRRSDRRYISRLKKKPKY